MNLFSIRAGLCSALALAASCLTGPATGEPVLAGGAGAHADVIRVELSAAGPASRTLALGKGKSAQVELPIDARDVTVTSPAVADVVLRTPRRISVLGMATGQTDAVFFDGMGKRILSLDIRVDQDATAVAQTIARVLPGARITVEAVNNSLVLTGQVPSASDSDKAQQIAAQFVDRPDRVLNMLAVAGKDQVMLKVRVVEVSRSAVKQLGYNLAAVVGKAGGNQWAAALAPTWAVNGAQLGGLVGGFNRDAAQPTADGLNKANATMQAFERVGLMRTLAEPNLTAVSGEAAKFLVGGEFPVPASQDAAGHVTVEYKQFGVGLGFTPVVLSSGRISLKLSTEVSELTNLGAFSTSGSGGLTIPGLNVRRAETTVELPSGGALMIAGLLQEQTKQNIDSLPGLINLPILGALFRSRDYLNGQTELVVIVTPYIVKPAGPGELQTPADGLQIADDGQTILLGKLAKASKASPEAGAGRTYQGPYGYVIE